MKLMKHITIALVLCAIPAVAFGQAGSADAVKTETTCPDPCYVAPLFTASGGFVAKQAKKDDEATTDKDEGAVNFALTCGNTVMTASAAVGDDGIVRQVLNMDNGMHCDGLGKIEIDNVEEGGWYWVHDDPNSAVASLVDRNVLDNAGPVAPTDPGGVTLTSPMDGKATLVKHEASGRIGILSHIMPMPDPTLCGGESGKTNDCKLMASYNIELKSGADAATATTALANGGTLTRGAAAIIVVASIAGSGYIDTTDDNTNPAGTWADASGPNSAVLVDVTGGGVTAETQEITVNAAATDSGRCATTNADRGTPVVVNLSLSALTGVVPVPGSPVTASFSVACPAPASSSAPGQELVPENPFPVE